MEEEKKRSRESSMRAIDRFGRAGNTHSLTHSKSFLSRINSMGFFLLLLSFGFFSLLCVYYSVLFAFWFVPFERGDDDDG